MENGGNKMSIECRQLGILITALGFLFGGITALGQAAGTPTAAESDSDSTTKATNPVTPKLTLQAWDNWQPRASGAGGRGANTGLSRNIIPVKMFGVMNLFHVEQPIVTNPNVPGGTQTGAGGTILYNVSVVQKGTTSYGVGPLVVLPDVTNSNLGTEKWQAGVASAVLDATKWGLLGGILTYQHSFGRGAGPISSAATFQPFIHYNLRRGLYLQSEGLTVISSGSGARIIPVGFGLGKVWTYASGRTVSAFLEPQYSVWHRGAGTPTWQLFSGVSVQIPVSFKLFSK
jgi:hypothetical protein